MRVSGIVALVGCSLAQSEQAFEYSLLTPRDVPVEAQSAQNIVIASPTDAPQLTTPTPIPPTMTPVPTEDRNMSDYPDLGVAPEFRNTVWLNVDEPLRLANLRGQVVLLEFWTFDCINCIHTIPYVQAFHETYQSQGLVVIGDHYPEFSYERDLQNVRAAIDRLGIAYPVAQDNNRQTWSAYNQRYWPTLYVIDKWGHIRYKHVGAGRYDQIERAIQATLAENYTESEESATTGDLRQYLTPTIVLNVRNGAGIENDLIGSIQPGMAFVVQGEQNGWYMIDYNDGVGYVSGDYVTTGFQ
jgi:thiol-disulfide isomerase/thioredoxin